MLFSQSDIYAGFKGFPSCHTTLIFTAVLKKTLKSYPVSRNDFFH